MPNNERGNLIDFGRQVYDAIRITGQFDLSAGGTSDYYLDKFLFETRPDLLAPIASELARHLPEGTRRIASPELGAVPLGTAVSLASGLPFVIVRKSAKNYGSRQLFEGLLAPGDDVTIVEDIVTTGAESLRTARAMSEAGANILLILAVIDREEGGAANIEAAGYRFRSLYRQSEIDSSLR